MLGGEVYVGFAFAQQLHGLAGFVFANDAIIDGVLITGTANIAPADLKIIKSVAAEYVRDIFCRLREHGCDENTMTLYVTGGGGCLVKNFYKFSTDRVKFVEDICAAAKGYSKRPQWHRKHHRPQTQSH